MMARVMCAVCSKCSDNRSSNAALIAEKFALVMRRLVMPRAVIELKMLFHRPVSRVSSNFLFSDLAQQPL